ALVPYPHCSALCHQSVTQPGNVVRDRMAGACPPVPGTAARCCLSNSTVNSCSALPTGEGRYFFNCRVMATLDTYINDCVMNTWLSEDVTRMLIAMVVGAVIGTEREYRSKSAGLRTTILVCMGACLFTLLSIR